MALLSVIRHWHFRDRVDGARELLQANGITLPANQVEEVAYDVAAARLGFTRLIERNPNITALICGQDVIAYGAILQAHHRGLRVPADLSVIGFDDLELSQHITPALTTIRYNANDMWSKAADSLLTRIEGERPPLALFHRKRHWWCGIPRQLLGRPSADAG